MLVDFSMLYDTENDQMIIKKQKENSIRNKKNILDKLNSHMNMHIIVNSNIT